MRRLIVTAFFIAISVSVFAQPGSKPAQDEKKETTKPKESKEEKKHKEKKEKSKTTGKALVSKDTLFCGGKPVCIAKETSKNLLGTVTAYSLRGFKATEDELHITLGNVSSGANIVYFWVWVSGDVRFETEHKESPIELVCYYYLYKDSVMDKKNFNTLRQSKAKAISGYNGQPAPKPKDDPSTNRNRNDRVTFTGRDIRQSSVLIGHIESATSTQGGSIITTYTIYNTAGNLVATAKNHGVTDHEWDIVTANDNRQHHVSSTILHDQEDVVTFLVRLLYI